MAAEEKEKPIWERVTSDGIFREEEEKEVEYSEIEQRAMEKGWRPQNEWTGNEDDFRSAKEYLDRGSFFEKINNQKKELDELKAFQIEAREHLRKLRESQERDRLDKFNNQKREALEENDIEGVMRADTNIRTIEQEIANITKPPTQQYTSGEDQMFDEWKDDNPWYDSDNELRVLADALGTSFREMNPNATAQDVYKFVTEKVKAVNPNRFSPSSNTPQSRAPGSTTQQPNRSSTKHGKTYRDLSEEQLRIGRKFTKLGLYSDIQGYVNDLVASDGL
jgi:hypothetical protein